MCHNNSPFYFSFNAEHLQIHQRRMSITDKLRDVKSKQRISCYNNRCRKQPVRAGADRLLSCWRICCGVASSLFSLSPPSIPPQTALTVKTDKGEGLHSSYYIVHKVYHILSPWLYLVFQVCPPPFPTVVHVYTGHKCLCSHTPPSSALSAHNLKNILLVKVLYFMITWNMTQISPL